MDRKVLIAAAWPYANGSLHLGHVAGLIGADILARYHRLAGDQVGGVVVAHDEADVLVGVAVALLWRILNAPFGYAMRAGRDSPMRADAIGIDVKRVQWVAFVIAGVFAGVAGALYAFSKGSISPETLHVSRSVDGLVMVLLGGLQTLAGPIVGAVSFTWLHDVIARNTEYWRAMLGGIILLLVLLFPEGLAGFARRFSLRFAAKGRA